MYQVMASGFKRPGPAPVKRTNELDHGLEFFFMLKFFGDLVSPPLQMSKYLERLLKSYLLRLKTVTRHFFLLYTLC